VAFSQSASFVILVCAHCTGGGSGGGCATYRGNLLKGLATARVQPATETEEYARAMQQQEGGVSTDSKYAALPSASTPTIPPFGSVPVPECGVH
jgi:hypothetical protein